MARNARITIEAEDRTARAIRQARQNFQDLAGHVAKVGTAVGAAGIAFGAFSIQQARVIEEQKKFADQLGISTQSLNELAYAFGQEGNINAEQFADTLQELNVRLGEAAVTGGGPLVDAFQELGLSISEVRSLKTDEMVLKIADAFEKLDDKQRSQFLTEEIFAGEAAKMSTLLNKGSDAVKELTDEYRKLNGVLTEKEAEKIAGLSEAFKKLQVAFDGLVKTMLKVSSESMTEWIEDLTDALSGFSSWISSNQDAWNFILGMTPMGGFQTYRNAASSLKNELLGIPDTIEEVEKSISVLDNLFAEGRIHPEKEAEAMQRLLSLYQKRKDILSEPLITITSGNDKDKDKTPDKKSTPLFFNTDEGRKAIREAMFNAELEAAQANADAINEIENNLQAERKRRAEEWENAWKSAQDTFASGMGDAVASAIIDQESLGKAMQATMRIVAREVISSLVRIGVQRAIEFATTRGQQAASTAAGVAQASALTAAYTPAAIAANIASFGAAGIAAAASSATAAAATIGAVSSGNLGILHDGLDYVPRTGTYLLEKGERVIKKEDNKAMAMGNTYNFSINALDTQTGVEFLMRNENAIVEMVQSRYEQRGEMGGPMR